MFIWPMAASSTLLDNAVSDMVRHFSIVEQLLQQCPIDVDCQQCSRITVIAEEVHHGAIVPLTLLLYQCRPIRNQSQRERFVVESLDRDNSHENAFPASRYKNQRLIWESRRLVTLYLRIPLQHSPCEKLDCCHSLYMR